MDAVRSEEVIGRNSETDEADDNSPWEKIDSCLGIEVFTRAYGPHPLLAIAYGLMSHCAPEQRTRCREDARRAERSLRDPSLLHRAPLTWPLARIGQA